MTLETIGTAIVGFLGAVGVALYKLKPWKTAAQAEVAANDAEATVISTLHREFERQAAKLAEYEARLSTLESKCERQARRIWQLEHELSRHGIEIPPEPEWAKTN